MIAVVTGEGKIPDSRDEDWVWKRVVERLRGRSLEAGVVLGSTVASTRISTAEGMSSLVVVEVVAGVEGGKRALERWMVPCVISCLFYEL
jgi:hypothetical protein